MSTPTTKYDHHFKTYADIYFEGEVSWQWFKAMGIAESTLGPKAVSPMGAKGIMQLMPRTSAEVARELWLPDEPFNPQINILMGIHYARKMWDIFQNEEGLDRLCFMFGAYNAGWANIVKAQKATSKPDIWDNIAAVLPQITGDKAFETINYVKHIRRIREEMIEVS